MALQNISTTDTNIPHKFQDYCSTHRTDHRSLLDDLDLSRRRYE